MTERESAHTANDVSGGIRRTPSARHTPSITRASVRTSPLGRLLVGKLTPAVAAYVRSAGIYGGREINPG